MEITLKIMSAKQPENSQKNIFKDAFFWFQKGYNIQTKVSQKAKDGDNVDVIALDYYLSGVKIDQQHMGCVYNVGCCYFFSGKFQNAQKWFSIGNRIDPMNQDCIFGLTISSLKLGQTQKALDQITSIEGDWKSTLYTREQFIFIKAICYRLLDQWPKAIELYDSLKEGCR